MTALTFNADQVRYFIRLLTGREDTPVTWQVYFDPKGMGKRDDLASHFVATFDQAHNHLLRYQSQYCGVYIGLNGSDGKGRKQHNIVDFRAVFADFDGIDQPDWPIPPHFVTQRDATHGHAFWLVDDIKDLETFRGLQRRIAMRYGSDYQVVDACRVVRAPGSLHYKDHTSPKQYQVTVDNKQHWGDRKYTVAEITNAFTLSEEKENELDRWLNSRDAITEGAGFSDTQVSRSRFIKFITIMAQPAIQGASEGGTYTLIKVASYGYDLGLPLEVAQELLWEHYDPRCVPSWHSTGERDHFNEVVERAYHYANNEPGCRTAISSFSQMAPVPIEPAPLTPQEVIRIGDRLDKREAAALKPQMNAKSAHYDLAKVFDGLLYNGTDLVCCEKIFYEFNGKSWGIVSDSVMKAAVQRFYAPFKPASKLTNGIFEVLRDLVNVPTVENGTWLHTGERASDIVCFKNGLVDLSANPPKIMPHTPDFFTFNELDYDYNVTAKCPQWLKMVGEIWDFDPQLIDQLQEFMGYSMVSDVSLQKFAAFTGKSRGGKGTITSIIRSLVGAHNTTAPSLSNLIKDSALHKMSTASLGLIPDAHSVSVNKRDEVLAMFKAITGGDPIDYHVMYKGTQTGVFKLKFILSTNGMPEFNDPSGALVARMLVFPFLKSFVGREDPNLKDKLLSEIPGIAQWALQGLNRLRANGRFTEAPSGLREKECIAEDMSTLSRFISDMCEMDSKSFVTNNDLYRVYTLWAKQHDITHPLSQPKVVREINASPLTIVQGRDRVEGKQVRGFHGLKLIRCNPVD